MYNCCDAGATQMGHGPQYMSSTSLMQMAMSMEHRLAVSILDLSCSFHVTLLGKDVHVYSVAENSASQLMLSQLLLSLTCGLFFTGGTGYFVDGLVGTCSD